MEQEVKRFLLNGTVYWLVSTSYLVNSEVQLYSFIKVCREGVQA